MHADAISISFSEIRQTLNISMPEINFYTRVEILENDPKWPNNV